MEIAIVLGLSAAEAAPSVATSASCYDQIEDVRILAIVKPELELVQVQRQIGLVGFVITTHDSALEQRPERFNRIGVSSADHVFGRGAPRDDYMWCQQGRIISSS